LIERRSSAVHQSQGDHIHLYYTFSLYIDNKKEIQTKLYFLFERLAD